MIRTVMLLTVPGAAVLIACLTGCTTGQAGGLQAAPFQAGTGLGQLYVMRDARTRRCSSADEDWRDGNNDSRPIPAGGTLELGTLEGPGVIRHIWFTPYGGGPKFPRAFVLRIYWDGNPEPAVEAPLGDFFAVGHGEQRLVNSLPVSVTSDRRAYNCYWPMPFARSARITMSNDGPEDGGLYWYIDYETVPRLPPDTAYFHAQYRQEYPCRMGQDYLILEAEGSGHYVGTVQSCQLRTPSWYGEGDDRFFIDGETEPSLRGTGTEDYFCDAWGFRLADRPFYGITVMDGFDLGDLITVYRWHIPDPVHFRKSLRVTIEHKGVTFDAQGNLVSGFMEREDLMSSVAFWYQTGRARRFAAVPPYAERFVPETRIELEGSLEAARAAIRPADAALEVQNLNVCSGNRQLFAKFSSPESVLTVPFRLEADLKGVVRLQVVKSFDYGQWRVRLDGKVVDRLEAVDLYHPSPVAHVLKLGYLELAAGDHELKFECVGRNEASRGFFLGVDAIWVQHITPFHVPPKAAQGG